MDYRSSVRDLSNAGLVCARSCRGVVSVKRVCTRASAKTRLEMSGGKRARREERASDVSAIFSWRGASFTMDVRETGCFGGQRAVMPVATAKRRSSLRESGRVERIYAHAMTKELRSKNVKVSDLSGPDEKKRPWDFPHLRASAIFLGNGGEKGGGKESGHEGYPCEAGAAS